jgi:hypothetical protein
MLTPASLKVTVPVGTGPAPLTTAVKVTDCPKMEGFAEDVRAVDDGTAAAASMTPKRRITTLSATARDGGTTAQREGINRDSLGRRIARLVTVMAEV